MSFLRPWITKKFPYNKYAGNLEKTRATDVDEKVRKRNFAKDVIKDGADLTFSGCDIIPVVYGKDKFGTTQLHVIGDIATLTYSIHQDKGAVRTLGRSAPRGFTRGPETIAGTMIFNVFNKQALYELTNFNRDPITGKTVYPHQLPSFDVILYFQNEANRKASLGIFGIQIMDEGQSHSVEDTYIENTIQYVALKVEPLEDFTDKNLDAIYTRDQLSFLSRTDQTKLAKKAAGPGGIPFDYSYISQPQ